MQMSFFDFEEFNELKAEAKKKEAPRKKKEEKKKKKAAPKTVYKLLWKLFGHDTTTEWKRASEAVGMDYSSLEFPNWDVTKDYTDADYAALK